MQSSGTFPNAATPQRPRPSHLHPSTQAVAAASTSCSRLTVFSCFTPHHSEPLCRHYRLLSRSCTSRTHTQIILAHVCLGTTGDGRDVNAHSLLLPATHSLLASFQLPISYPTVAASVTATYTLSILSLWLVRTLFRFAASAPA